MLVNGESAFVDGGVRVELEPRKRPRAELSHHLSTWVHHL